MVAGRGVPARRAMMVRGFARWMAAGLMWLLMGVALARGPAPQTVDVRDLPPEARAVLARIHAGGPFRYRRDGVTFYNRERLLPPRPRGYYTEYTVPTPGARDRGAKRIIAGQGDAGSPATSGEYWYTADHYASFQRIRE